MNNSKRILTNHSTYVMYKLFLCNSPFQTPFQISFEEQFYEQFYSELINIFNRFNHLNSISGGLYDSIKFFTKFSGD